MENASNALIIAGGILIGILIISLAVYLFMDFGSTSAEINKQSEEQQLVQFNTKFTSYENMEGLTIYNVITVAGYAQENNKYYGDDDNDKYYVDNYKVTVTLISKKGRTDEVQKKAISEYNKMIQDEQINENSLPEYNCKVDYHENGRVKSVTFTKK
jgi:hypothetical protein